MKFTDRKKCLEVGFYVGDVRAWLLQIVRNTCYTRLEKNRRMKMAGQFNEGLHMQSSATPESMAVAGNPLTRALEGRFLQRDCCDHFDSYEDDDVLALAARRQLHSALAKGCRRSVRMSCDFEYSALQSYFDGELSIVRVAEFKHHLADCSDCMDELAALSFVRGSLKYARLYECAPASLKPKIRADLHSITPTTRRSLPLTWRGLAAAAGLLLVVWILWRVYSRRAQGGALSSQIRRQDCRCAFTLATAGAVNKREFHGSANRKELVRR